MEYLLLLTSVVAIVLVGFRVYLPRIQESSNLFYNRAAYGIYGAPNRCGDGELNLPIESADDCCYDVGAGEGGLCP